MIFGKTKFLLIYFSRKYILVDKSIKHVNNLENKNIFYIFAYKPYLNYGENLVREREADMPRTENTAKRACRQYGG